MDVMVVLLKENSIKALNVFSPKFLTVNAVTACTVYNVNTT